jgi:hypothetical protein
MSIDRARINLWLSDTQYEWWMRCGAWSDPFVNAQVRLIEKPAKWLLCRLFGHKAIGDQCGIPEHDFCVWCDRSLPGQAPRRGGVS